jgi:phage terminase large subunit-like protein
MAKRPDDIEHPMQYAFDVIEGKILTCKLVQLAVKRHFNDLKKGHKRGLYFDETAANRAIGFFKFVKHYKGEFAGKEFVLSPWQKWLVWVLFGWKRDDGTRRFRYAYTEIARKGGKTTFAAVIGLYMMLADGEAGAEVYSSATKRDQAKICFGDAQELVKNSDLKRFATVYKHNIHSLKTASKFEPLSSDANSLDGPNPHCSIIDEFHAHKTPEMYNVMKSGMGARQQPMQFTITTAGFNKVGPCFKLRKTLIEILQGKKEDDAYFILIYTLDKDEEWEDETMWIKANPNLHYIPTQISYLRGEYIQAKNEGGTSEVNFKTKNLNLWTDASKTWISDEKWVGCQREIDWEELKGKPCYGGLDLAKSIDTSCLALAFPFKKQAWAVIEETEDGDEIITYKQELKAGETGELTYLDALKFKYFFWVPRDNAEERTRRDAVPYIDWIREEYIEATPGNVTDYNWIKARILRIAEQHQLKSIAYDRYNASTLVNDLMEEGVSMAPFGQGFVSMGAPTSHFERMVLGGLIEHDGNPVMRWMMGNIEIKRDPAGNIKIDKDKSSEKVDGPVATVMAIGEWVTNKDENSAYEDRGILFL